MKSLKQMLAAVRRGPTDVVGLDIGTAAIAAVRMRSGNDGLQVDAGALLELPDGWEDPEATVDRAAFPSRIRGSYASVAVSDAEAHIRLLSFPGRSSEVGVRVVDGLGLSDPENYRISYQVLQEGSARAETRAVAVAIPEPLAVRALSLLPTTGTPAPYSLEVSGLAALTAFGKGPLRSHEAEALGIVHFGETTSLFAIYHKGNPVLIRRFEKGTDDILAAVEQSLGVDRATATGIVSDGSFDISKAAEDVMQPLIKQMVLSRDFVERREKCSVGAVFVSGGLVVSRDVHEQVAAAMGIDVAGWNPLEGVKVSDGAIPPELASQTWRLTSAIGACQATLEPA